MLVASTYSLVACDPKAGTCGVVVQSKFFAVGSVVPWARACCGAVATQAFLNPSYGPRGLNMLSQGVRPDSVIERLVDGDADNDVRQLGIVDSAGRSAAYTGGKCSQWAGHLVGQNYACQGNFLQDSHVLKAMVDVFLRSKRTLAQRLILAVTAADEAGGDLRGRQAAALLVVGEKGGFGGLIDVLVNLRVDDHPNPVRELRRLYNLHLLYFDDDREWIELTTDVVRKIRRNLCSLGLLKDAQPYMMDTPSLEALQRYCLFENLRRRWSDTPDRTIDARVLQHLSEKKCEGWIRGK